MARRRRSSAQVLRDLAKKEKHDATKSTRETGEDRPDTRDSQAPTGSAPEATSTSEESDPKTEPDAGRSAEEEIAESTTRAAAKIVQPEPPAKPAVAKCPVCDERRFDPKLKGTAVKCTNCRRAVVLE